jgi:hypothetical protein
MPEPEREYRFAPPRRWRFDYAWPLHRVALEVEGGAFAGGRHTRGAGFRNDLEKYNTATAAGWRVFRVLPEQLLSVGVDYVKQAILHTVNLEDERTQSCRA